MYPQIVMALVFAAINCGVSQWSVLGALLILLYTNDLNQVIKFWIHHFPDDIDLLCLSNSIEKVNKIVNADLKHLVNWLNAKKNSLNVKKFLNSNQLKQWQ